MKSKKRIKVDMLARVEGEGGITIQFKGDKVVGVRFDIFEPPRLFEAFLRGRNYAEAPDITARICGICPIAYMMSACQAMESAFNITVDEPLKALRRLIYCGEWIESHALHIYMLHAPDFLGYQDAIRLGTDHPEILKRGLELKKIGNAVMRLIGGREIHPVNIRVGGFYRLPTRSELNGLVEDLKWACEAAYETVCWAAALPFPDFERPCEFVALSHPDCYAIMEGRLVSNQGLDIAVNDFDRHIAEEHLPHSTALHARIKSRGPYCVGPPARFNLNFNQLSTVAKHAAQEAGLAPPCCNPFKSIIIRSIETLYACDEALRIIQTYEQPAQPAIEARPQAAVGYGCTEAPRGICWHRYKLDESGAIMEARIVPPTSQNQKAIEMDLGGFVEKHSELPREELIWLCEQAVRNYDPCISCSCHCIDLPASGTGRTICSPEG